MTGMFVVGERSELLAGVVGVRGFSSGARLTGRVLIACLASSYCSLGRRVDVVEWLYVCGIDIVRVGFCSEL